MKIIVSRCLLGEKCRYDGVVKHYPAVTEYLKNKEIIPICPEVAGGLPVPRVACDLSGGDGNAVLKGTAKVINREGDDKTQAFILGAKVCFDSIGSAKKALLKYRSPSCGRGIVWIDGALTEGDGVFAAMLKNEGIEIISEEDL